MNGARIVAILLLAGAAAWIGSGYLDGQAPVGPRATTEAQAKPEEKVEAPKQLFRVAVAPATVEQRVRKLRLSGVTEADRRVMATARANGVVVELKVRPGARVKAGDVLAVLSDEAREAAVTQAKARVEQRIAEWKAREKLIASGTLAALNRPQLEAEVKAAEAALALAEAERKRGTVLAPIDGVVDKVPAEIGQALQNGGNIAEVIGLDPMLAVAELTERRLGQVRVGDAARVRLVTGQEVEGKVRFVSSRAVPQTRTYRIEIAIANPDVAIRDGVTAEIELDLAPVTATPLPRSALTFSAAGKLGVRVVVDGVVAFAPLTLVEDSNDTVWVSGLTAGQAVIVQGQDFVTEGQKVEAVAPATASARRS